MPQALSRRGLFGLLAGAAAAPLLPASAPVARQFFIDSNAHADIFQIRTFSQNASHLYELHIP